jgi:hypothetical protein
VKIIKVITDELPKSCLDCEIGSDDDFGNYYCCDPEIGDGIMDVDYYFERHPDCPLALLTRDVVYELHDKWAVKQLDKESER